MAYIILAAIGFLPALFVAVRRRDPVLVATFFAAGALMIVAEYIASGLFELYWYRPGLMASPLSDTAVGVILAELFFGPALAALLATFLSPIWGALLGSGLVVGIEALFLRWGIYLHTGWKLWHSILLFPVYFLAVNRYRSWARDHGVSSGVIRTAARLGIITWWLHLVGVSAAWLFRPVTYQIDLLPTFARNQALGWGLTNWIIAAPLFLWVLSGASAQRLSRAVVTLFSLFVAAYGWKAVGLWAFRPPWHPVWHTAVHGVILAAMWATDRGIDLLAPDTKAAEPG